jgi:hypothetical protein
MAFQSPSPDSRRGGRRRRASPARSVAFRPFPWPILGRKPVRTSRVRVFYLGGDDPALCVIDVMCAVE